MKSVYLRTTVVTTFYETLDSCFETVLRDMLGVPVRDTIFKLIERNGVPRADISTRFDDTVEIMVKALGTASRVIVLRTISEMCKQYSQRMEFSYQDSLRDRLLQLKESVVANHLVPRRLTDTQPIDNFLSRDSSQANVVAPELQSHATYIPRNQKLPNRT